MASFPRVFTRLVLLVIALVNLGLIAAAWKRPAAVGFDAAMGLLILRSWEQGAPLNHLRHPSPDDISRDEDTFVAWWSPGQYAVPAVASKLSGLEIGRALHLVTALSGIIALAGYWLLYRQLGFSPAIASLSLLGISLHHSHVASFVSYRGGGTLLPAILPFLMLAACRWRDRWTSVVLLASAALVAFFLKASAIVIFLGLLLGIVLRRAVHRNESSTRARLLVLVSATAAIVLLTVHWGYLQHGMTIGEARLGPDPGPGLLGRLRILFFPLAAPLYALFPLGNWLDRTLFYIPVGVAAVYVTVAVGRRSDPVYRSLLWGLSLFALFFFSAAYFTRMDVSYEGRHFEFLGFVLLPGLFAWAAARRAALAALAAGFLGLGGLALAQANPQSGPGATETGSLWGLRQPVNPAALSALHDLDKRLGPGRAIFYNGFAARPEVALEIVHGRVLLHDNFSQFGFDHDRRVRPRPWRGRTEAVVFIVDRAPSAPTLIELAAAFREPLEIEPIQEFPECALYLGRFR